MRTMPFNYSVMSIFCRLAFFLPLWWNLGHPSCFVLVLKLITAGDSFPRLLQLPWYHLCQAHSVWFLLSTRMLDATKLITAYAGVFIRIMEVRVIHIFNQIIFSRVKYEISVGYIYIFCFIYRHVELKTLSSKRSNF